MPEHRVQPGALLDDIAGEAVEPLERDPVFFAPGNPAVRVAALRVVNPDHDLRCGCGSVVVGASGPGPWLSSAKLECLRSRHIKRIRSALKSAPTTLNRMIVWSALK